MIDDHSQRPAHHPARHLQRLHRAVRRVWRRLRGSTAAARPTPPSTRLLNSRDLRHHLAPLVSRASSTWRVPACRSEDRRAPEGGRTAPSSRSQRGWRRAPHAWHRRAAARAVGHNVKPEMAFMVVKRQARQTTTPSAVRRVWPRRSASSTGKIGTLETRALADVIVDDGNRHYGDRGDRHVKMTFLEGKRMV